MSLKDLTIITNPGTASYSNKILKLHRDMLNNIIKSENDERMYRGIRLSNGIECLLVSDPEAKISSAALSVAVGSLEDPWDKQGLSHFL
jgi:secreted Zn-dependent insulinase-like peptidase